MVAAFIRERGVTRCPPCGSKELATVHVERARAEALTGGGWRGMHRRAKTKAGLP